VDDQDKEVIRSQRFVSQVRVALQHVLFVCFKVLLFVSRTGPVAISLSRRTPAAGKKCSRAKREKKKKKGRERVVFLMCCSRAGSDYGKKCVLRAKAKTKITKRKANDVVMFVPFCLLVMCNCLLLICYVICYHSYSVCDIIVVLLLFVAFTGVCLPVQISMQHENSALRDPALARCVAAAHARTGEQFRCYPTYDLAIAVCDDLEGVTHAMRDSQYQVNKHTQTQTQTHMC
jgi:hypothetical protein